MFATNGHSHRPGATKTGHLMKGDTMAFALILILVLLLSSAYLLNQWYSGELQEPRT